MESLLSFVSLGKILSLPWYVGMPGIALIALLLFSAVKSLLTLSPVKAVTRLILAFAIAVILTQGGDTIVQLIGRQAAS